MNTSEIFEGGLIEQYMKNIEHHMKNINMEGEEHTHSNLAI